MDEAHPREPIAQSQREGERQTHHVGFSQELVALPSLGVAVAKLRKVRGQVPLDGLARPLVDQLGPEQLPGIIDLDPRVQGSDAGLLVRPDGGDQDDLQAPEGSGEELVGAGAGVFALRQRRQRRVAHLVGQSVLGAGEDGQADVRAQDL